VMMALWAVGIASFAEGNVVLSAVVLALATVVKVTPLMLVPLFVLWKDRRWLLSYSVALLGMIGAMGAVNGWDNMLAYRHVVAGMGNSVPTLLNRCISSLIAWIYYGRFVPMPRTGETFADPPKALALLGKVCSMGFYGICLFLAWRRRKVSSYESRAATMAIFALVSVLVSPVTWRHGYTMAFVPLAVLWVQTLRRPVGLGRTVLLALTSICVGTVFLDLAAQASLPFVLRILCAGAWTVLSVALCIEALDGDFGADSVAASQDGGVATAI
jgi:Glycosyltransferase family 87